MRSRVLIRGVLVVPRVLLVTLLLVANGLIGELVWADTVTFNYDGYVTQWMEFSGEDGVGSLGGTVSNGDTISGSLSYDSVTGDIISVSLDIGGIIQYIGGSSPYEYVSVDNNWSGYGWDNFDAHTNEYNPQAVLSVPSGVTYSDLNVLAWGIGLYDESGTVFTDNTLPTSINLTDFDSGTFQLRSWFPDNSGDGVAQGAWGIWGNLTIPVIPEPVSSTLFLVGAATLGFRQFRKKFKKYALFNIRSWE